MARPRDSGVRNNDSEHEVGIAQRMDLRWVFSLGIVRTPSWTMETVELHMIAFGLGAKGR
jgi:hypothetical protein